MNSFRTIKKYLSILVPFLGAFLIAVFFEAFAAVLLLTIPLFLRVIFDYVYPFGDIQLLNITIVGILVTYIIHLLLGTLANFINIHIGEEARCGLAEKVYGTLQRLPLQFYINKRSNDLLARVTDDVAKMVSFILRFLPTIVIQGGKLIIIIAISFYINPKIAVLGLISIPLYIFESEFYAKKRSDAEEELTSADINILSHAEEKLAGIKTVKAFSQERNETLSFATLLQKYFRFAVKAKITGTFQAFTNSTLLLLWTALLLWYLGFQAAIGKISVGEIVAVIIYFGFLKHPIRDFIDLFNNFQTNIESIDRIDEILSSPVEEQKEEQAGDLKIEEGKVLASGISFSNFKDKILDNIEVEFKPKCVTAIVGASIDSNEAIMNLLMRFSSPSAGIISIDGKNIAEARLCDLRKQVGIAEQEATIFDGTVMENILYGSEGLERGDAVRAARLSGAHDFIEKLPGGYDAQVGVGGELLTSGQRQRLAIARVLLKNPNIIIFNEHTKALDAESEYHIQETMASLARSKTVVVLASRLSTIKNAGKIIVIEEGKFVEEGQFDELMEIRGAFYKFYWRQFGGLSNFRAQLEMELERSKRYGSKFCLAVLKLSPATSQSINDIDLLIKRSMRIGDNSAILDGCHILILLPEIDGGQLSKFFKRMTKLITENLSTTLDNDIYENDISFTGTRITKKISNSPEELIHKLVVIGDETNFANANNIVDEDKI